MHGTEERKQLDHTGKLYFVEHSRNIFWGNCLDGTAQNALGFLLMRIRGNMAPRPDKYLHWLLIKSSDTVGKSNSGFVLQSIPKCKRCHQKYCYQNPQGGYYDFCSKNCTGSLPAVIANSGVNLTISSSPMCKSCHKNPCCANPQGGYYDFCCKSCPCAGTQPQLLHVKSIGNAHAVHSIPKCKRCYHKDCWPNPQGGIMTFVADLALVNNSII